MFIPCPLQQNSYRYCIQVIKKRIHSYTSPFAIWIKFVIIRRKNPKIVPCSHTTDLTHCLFQGSTLTFQQFCCSRNRQLHQLIREICVGAAVSWLFQQRHYITGGCSTLGLSERADAQGGKHKDDGYTRRRLLQQARESTACPKHTLAFSSVGKAQQQQKQKLQQKKIRSDDAFMSKMMGEKVLFPFRATQSTWCNKILTYVTTLQQLKLHQTRTKIAVRRPRCFLTTCDTVSWPGLADSQQDLIAPSLKDLA